MIKHAMRREKTQLSMLMSLIRQSIQEPLQRLPALTVVYLAEASCALTHPGCDLFPAVSRHLSRKPSLDLQVDTVNAGSAAHPRTSLSVWHWKMHWQAPYIPRDPLVMVRMPVQCVYLIKQKCSVPQGIEV